MNRVAAKKGFGCHKGIIFTVYSGPLFEAFDSIIVKKNYDEQKQIEWKPIPRKKPPKKWLFESVPKTHTTYGYIANSGKLTASIGSRASFNSNGYSATRTHILTILSEHCNTKENSLHSVLLVHFVAKHTLFFPLHCARISNSVFGYCFSSTQVS